MDTRSQDTRYHHYIPQFLLRNFAHPRGSSKKGKGKRNTNRRQGEPMLNAIKLSGDDKVEIIETPVRRTFGVQDLYLDSCGNPQNMHHIEELLGRLEGSAARVIQKIRDGFERRTQVANSQVTLTRVEKDTLRKFLFVMRYRRKNIKNDHEGETIEAYCGPDKEELDEYMRKKGLDKPVDVWLDNLKAFIEIEIGTSAEKWQSELMLRAYPPHAQLFIINLDWFYLALCTPSQPDDEFLMTENGFGVHEGPVTFFTDVVTKQTRGMYTEYHIFAHISPKLSMILRSQTLPLPVEDAVESIRSMRESHHNLTITLHNLPEGTNSFLQELPVTKARNSYTKVENGIIVPLNGVSPVLQLSDKFFFKFFPISTELTNKINCVFLEHAHSTSMIVFNKKKSVCQAIEYYLTEELGQGWKEVKGKDDPILIYLKKLEEASILLGRKTVANYQVEKGRLFLGHSVLGKVDQVFDLVDADVGTKKIYNKLRYLSVEPPNQVELQPLDREDFEQAAKMLKLRIKIDTWTRGLEEQVREDTRDNLRDLYCELPIQQIWIYVKRIRFMKNGGTVLGPDNKIADSNLSAELLPGPEDVVAQMAQIFVRPHHCRMIFYAALNGVHMANPSFGLAKPFTLDSEGATRLKQEIWLALGSQGSICNCGIPRIEEAACKYRDTYKTSGPHDSSFLGPILQRVLKTEDIIEIMTRLEVEERFRNLMTPELPDKAIGDLRDVLFQVVFPYLELTRKQPELVQLREVPPEPERPCVLM